MESGCLDVPQKYSRYTAAWTYRQICSRSGIELVQWLKTYWFWHVIVWFICIEIFISAHYSIDITGNLIHEYIRQTFQKLQINIFCLIYTLTCICCILHFRPNLNYIHINICVNISLRTLFYNLLFASSNGRYTMNLHQVIKM